MIYESSDLKIIDLNQKESSSADVLEDFRVKMAKAKEQEDKLTKHLTLEKSAVKLESADEVTTKTDESA